MTYYRQPLTEAQCQSVDEGEPVLGPTMGQMAKKPATAEAIANARKAKDMAYWQELGSGKRRVNDQDVANLRPVWDTMPGSTCMMDALRLIAFAKLPH